MKDWPTYFQNINSMATALKLTETFSLHLQKKLYSNLLNYCLFQSLIFEFLTTKIGRGQK